MSGNDVEDLAWRLFSGSERPARAPKAVAILVGVNNLQVREGGWVAWRGRQDGGTAGGHSSRPLETHTARMPLAAPPTACLLMFPHPFLLRPQAKQKVSTLVNRLEYTILYLQSIWPQTKIVVMALLPNDASLWGTPRRCSS